MKKPPHWLLNRVLFHLVPGACLLCHLPSNRYGDLCHSCDASLPRNTHCCKLCAAPLSAQGIVNSGVTDSKNNNLTICGRCLKQPPAFTSAYAPWVYRAPVDDLIRQFKHHGSFSAGKALYQPLLERFLQHYSLQSHDPRPPDAIIPVPLHWKKRWQRGFNQSHWLASRLSSDSGVQLLHNVIIRSKPTASQQSLPRKQRLQNLKGCFSVRKGLQGKSLALVDDVMTTGSTADEISRTLLNAGAAEVTAWCLARTPLEK